MILSQAIFKKYISKVFHNFKIDFLYSLGVILVYFEKHLVKYWGFSKLKCSDI